MTLPAEIFSLKSLAIAGVFVYNEGTKDKMEVRMCNSTR